MLYLYKLHWLQILEENLRRLREFGHQKIMKYVIANTRKQYQFWLIFSIKLVQCKLPVYILGMLSRVVIWNETTKQVILDTGNIFKCWGWKSMDFSKELARTSEEEQRQIICTRRGWKVQIRKKTLFIDQDKWLEQDVTTLDILIVAIVVATARPMSNDSTSNKSHRRDIQ